MDSSAETEKPLTLRWKGDSTTKIHVIADTLGKPLDFIMTGGQADPAILTCNSI